MTQYYNAKKKLPNSPLKLKSTTKNKTGSTLRLASTLIDNTTDC